jgi:hypothetical protein
MAAASARLVKDLDLSVQKLDRPLMRELGQFTGLRLTETMQTDCYNILLFKVI